MTENALQRHMRCVQNEWVRLQRKQADLSWMLPPLEHSFASMSEGSVSRMLEHFKEAIEAQPDAFDAFRSADVLILETGPAEMIIQLEHAGPSLQARWDMMRQYFATGSSEFVIMKHK